MSDKHPTTLQGMEPAVVGEALAAMRYDALEVTLRALARRLYADSEADLQRGRSQLAMHLNDAATLAADTAAQLMSAWQICAPHMDVGRIRALEPKPENELKVVYQIFENPADGDKEPRLSCASMEEAENWILGQYVSDQGQRSFSIEKMYRLVRKDP